MDSRVAEIAWMAVIAVLVLFGGNVVLGLLARNRAFGTLLLAIVVVLSLLMLRRAFIANRPTVRSDLTKAGAYVSAAVLAFVAIGLHAHWAIGACIAAAEVAIVFDIITIAMRSAPGSGAEHPASQHHDR